MLQERLGLSEQRACQIVGQHRSTQRHRPAQPTPMASCDPAAQLRQATPAVGVPAGPCRVGPKGHRLNRKKAQRLWREEGLRVPQRRRKRQRTGTSTTPADRLVTTHPDHVWALDFQFDVTAAGRVIKLLHVVDEFTRESLSDLVAHSIDADATVACLDRIVAARGTHPHFVRCDNGPELTANALRD